jgi:hypothetical protein
MSRFVQALIGFTLLALLILIKVAAADEQPHQPRTLGQRAVMNVYWYSPATLEITSEQSYGFKSEGECKDAITKAIAIAVVVASDGDMVNAECVGMHPPKREPKPGDTVL